MRHGWWMLAIVVYGGAAAQAQPLEVDQAEVLRLGNSVQYVDGRIAAGADEELAALGPPASDADKWFISLVTTQGCAACERLKQAWRSDPWLLALAHPEDPKSSWAHYNEYLYEDQSQAFRWQDIQIAAFPTVLVQPPRSGRYGDPATVVFQDTYRGDPRALAERITRAIRRYVARVDVPRAAEPGPRASDELAVAPPWQPPPKPDGRPPLDLPPLPIPPAIPPDEAVPPATWQILLWQILGAILTAVLGYFAGRRFGPTIAPAPVTRPKRKRAARRQKKTPEPAQA